jgi:TolB-like protein
MSFFEELKRRNVIRVGIAYVVTAWLIAQVADLALDNFEAPGWVIKTILLVLALGLPVAVFFAWAFELTPEGIKKESDVDRRESITPKTGRKLDRVIIGVLVLSVAYFAVDKFLLRSSDRAPVAQQAETTAPAALQTETTAPDKATAPAEKSIAVLPFVNMSADPDNEYFADGLSEELLNQLAQIPELMVVGRTSSFSFKGKNADLRNIGTTLGVAHVLEGSVRRQADKVRIMTQLIRVSDGFHLWSETYDRTLENVFAIQDDIAASVARALRLVLDDEARNAMQAVGVRNVDAFVAYQKGYDLYQKAHGDAPTLATLAEAQGEFERAIRTSSYPAASA